MRFLPMPECPTVLQSAIKGKLINHLQEIVMALYLRSKQTVSGIILMVLLLSNITYSPLAFGIQHLPGSIPWKNGTNHRWWADSFPTNTPESREACDKNDPPW